MLGIMWYLAWRLESCPLSVFGTPTHSPLFINPLKGTHPGMHMYVRVHIKMCTFFWFGLVLLCFLSQSLTAPGAH